MATSDKTTAEIMRERQGKRRKRQRISCFLKNSTATYARRSQSIKIGTDLSIDKLIKIGKFDLIDIDFIDQSVEIDDTLICFIDFS